MYEYMETLFAEPMPKYAGYKPDVHPGISHVFQSAAFRFGHTMIPPGLYRRYLNTPRCTQTHTLPPTPPPTVKVYVAVDDIFSVHFFHCHFETKLSFLFLLNITFFFFLMPFLLFLPPPPPHTKRTDASHLF